MPYKLNIVAFILSALFLVGCSSEDQSTATAMAAPVQVAAHTILKNGKIYTMDSTRSWADSVAISDGRIVFVGSGDEAEAYAGDTTRVIDLDGSMVLPSFQDVHIHPVTGGILYNECSLFDLETLDAVLAAISLCVEQNPDADFINGGGWGWEIFIGSDGPHRNLLDEIDSTRPLFFGDSDGHTLWVNSAALSWAGIDASTPVPEGGDFGRDSSTGELTGTLLEGSAMSLIYDRMPAYSTAQKMDALRYTQSYLHSLGITAIQDALVHLQGNEPYKSLDAYQALQEAGELNLRVVAALYWQPGAGLDQIEALKAARAQYSKGRLQAHSIKFWADGIIETHTAMMLEPYSDQADNRGFMMVSLEEMLAAVPKLDAEGFQIHIHAIGDATVRYALDALEGALEVNGKRDSRHLTAHTQLVHPDDIARFGQLNVIAGFSPYWAYADEYVAIINPPQLGPERMGWMYPIKSITDTGGRVAFGSDWYVSNADPLLGIETAVTRVEPQGEPTPVFIPEQRISLDQAIAGYTIDAAFANFLDADTGSIEVGKYADLVVLEQNLFDIEPAAISDAGLKATLLEGELVFGEL
ncbi:MAG: amidohydrolase [Pseudomonadales bacterium]